MAILQNPGVIVLDEPAANLLLTYANEVLKTIHGPTKERSNPPDLSEQNGTRSWKWKARTHVLVGRRNVFKGTARGEISRLELAMPKARRTM
jgi:ABC-type branched-subunit amino acid transport system ATPase component